MGEGPADEGASTRVEVMGETRLHKVCLKIDLNAALGTRVRKSTIRKTKSHPYSSWAGRIIELQSLVCRERERETLCEQYVFKCFTIMTHRQNSDHSG